MKVVIFSDMYLPGVPILFWDPDCKITHDKAERAWLGWLEELGWQVDRKNKRLRAPAAKKEST